MTQCDVNALLWMKWRCSRGWPLIIQDSIRQECIKTFNSQATQTNPILSDIYWFQPCQNQNYILETHGTKAPTCYFYPWPTVGHLWEGICLARKITAEKGTNVLNLLQWNHWNIVDSGELKQKHQKVFLPNAAPIIQYKHHFKASHPIISDDVSFQERQQAVHQASP